ncbi:MAG: DNA repair protein RadA [Alphaproteobacteria bacterium]
MAKNSQFVCQACGAVHRKWSGKCDACGEWNSIVEEAAPEAAPKGLKGGGGRKVELSALAGKSAPTPRLVSGVAEFDRVVGGGLVHGSATLIGGDPGIGKSTILLQIAASLSASVRVVYISGEEAIDQVRMRAVRLDMARAKVELAAATNVRDIIATLDTNDAPRVVIIDSIQTMYVDNLDSAPGTVAQVRAAAQELIRLAKRRGIAVLLVGHVTKDGMIAGPRVLEHMVDTVLYFEGERGHHFRILRSVKNRFGPTDEIGVFEMTGAGLMEVGNPSALFLGERDGHASVSGAAVFAGIEGTRPLLVEIQALVSPSAFATPRRAVVGWDAARLHMVLAVLEARCGVSLAGRDVYLNVAGGLRIAEPAADLAVAAAVISSLADCPVPPATVIFGEIGLSGEIRAVSQMDNRLKEAAKLGFRAALMPKRRGVRAADVDIQAREYGRVAELLPLFDAADAGKTARRS